MTLRCEACGKVPAEGHIADWAYAPELFQFGNLPKGKRGPNKKYHIYYGKRKSWEARGRALICGLLRESHPDEDAFDWLLGLMR